VHHGTTAPRPGGDSAVWPDAGTLEGSQPRPGRADLISCGALEGSYLGLATIPLFGPPLPRTGPAETAATSSIRGCWHPGGLTTTSRQGRFNFVWGFGGELSGLGDNGGRSRCLARPSHARGRLRRPQHRALGVAGTLEGSQPRPGRAEM
jgi:hypothetical protein